MLVLGIDPGGDGGATLLTVEPEPRLFLPPLPFKGEGIYTRQLFEWCVFYRPIVFMEKVGAMPGQGTASMFTFGFNTGRAETAVTIGGLDIIYFQNDEWQRVLGLSQFREIPDKPKRRAAQRQAQKEFALTLHPELSAIKGDVTGSVLIARAGVKRVLCNHARVRVGQRPICFYCGLETKPS